MPKARLTKSVIDKLPASAGAPVVYFDETMPGFGLRVGQQKKTFIVQRDVNGKTLVRTIGTYGVWTPDQAREAAREKLYLLSKGIDPYEETRKRNLKSITLRDVLAAFLEARKKLKPRTRNAYKRYMEFYLGDWMDKPITDITDDKFYKRYVYIGENNGKAVANSVRRALSSLLNYSIAVHKIMDRNPVRIIADSKAGYPNNRRRVYIKPSQLPAWYAAVNSLPNRIYRDYLLFVLFTGLRRTEAASIKWGQVDFADSSFTILETKNGDVLTLPMSNFVYNLLTERRQLVRDSEFVFPGVGKKGFLAEPKKAVDAVRKMSGVEFTVHDLRRTFVTYAESLDVSAYSLKALLNHKMSDITATYIVIDVERLREPMQKIASYIEFKIAEA